MKNIIILAGLITSTLSLNLKAQNWTAVSTGVGTSGSSSVDVLAPYKNVLLAAGRYESITQWDGNSWSAFSTGSPSSTALFVDGDTIYSGGQATGGNNSLSIYNGTSWAAFGGANTYDSLSWNTNDKYTAIFKYNNNLYITWNGAVMWFDPSIQKFHQAGNCLNDINQYSSNAKYAGIMGNKVYFTSTKPNTLIWDGNVWDTLNYYSSYTQAFVSGATVINNELYISGYFAKNSILYTLIKYDGANFSDLVGFPPFYTALRENSYVLGTYNASGYNYVGMLNNNSLVQLGNTTVTTNINAFAHYNNEIYVGGYFSSFAGVPANNIAKIGIPTGVNETKQANVAMLVYPNPAKDKLVIQLPEFPLESALTLDLFDVVGQRIKQVSLHSKITSIDLENASSGIYFYQLQDNNNILKTGKIIIE